MDSDLHLFPLHRAITARQSKQEMPDQPCRNITFPVSRKILFLNGYGSQPGGINPTILAVHGHSVVEPKLPDNNFARSVTIAQRVFDRHQPDVVVGWSRGGAAAMSLDRKDASLVLVAPAWKNWGTMASVKPEVAILHSPHDELVSIEDSRELLRNSGLAEDSLVAVGQDHLMIDEAAFMALLHTVESAGLEYGKRQAA